MSARFPSLPVLDAEALRKRARWSEGFAAGGDRLDHSAAATGEEAELGVSSTSRRLCLPLGDLARHGLHEALHLGLVVVVVQTGADERVDSARGHIDS